MPKARQAAAREEWELAAQLAQKAIAEKSDVEEAWALLAEAQMAMGDTAAGVASFEKALSLEPRLPRAVLALTQFYLKQNRVEDAERVVAAAEARDKKGKYDEIKVARGQIYAKRGNMAEATRILASATLKNPKNPLYPKILARIYEDQKVYVLAEQHYAAAWELAPGDPVLAYEYALVLQKLGKYNEALELFKQVQEKDPSNKAVDYMIGRLYFAADRYAEAAAQFEKAVEKRPDHFLSYLLLGRSYLEFSKAEKKNYYPHAEKALRRAVELRPERADARTALAEVLLSEARIYYQRALTDSGAAMHALCDSSLLFAHEALRYDSTLPGAYSQIARAHFKLGHLDSTIYYTRRQLTRTPGDQTELVRLVSALQRKKDQRGLVETLGPMFDSLQWSAGPRHDSVETAADKFLEKFAGPYVNALIETGDSRRAREVLKIMLAYKPDWCDGHGLNAYIDLKRENFAAAIPSLLAGVRACPRDKDLWLQLGDSYYFADPKNRENLKKAKEAYGRACDLGSTEGCEKYGQLP